MERSIRIDNENGIITKRVSSGNMEKNYEEVRSCNSGTEAKKKNIWEEFIVNDRMMFYKLD